MRVPRPDTGLRARLTLALGAGALVLSTFLATGTYVVAHRYLLDQRQHSATRTALADAAVVRDGLLTAGRPVGALLADVAPDAGSVVVLQLRGSWYSSSIVTGEHDLPAEVRAAVDGGQVVHGWARLAGRPAVVVGVPLPQAQARLYELRSAQELAQTLRTLRGVLAVLALVTAAGGALLGRRVAAAVMRPLDDVAAAAGRVAAGDMATRLRATSDPDLAGIVGSFNAMVDVLDERLARDARFAADVSHELRTPLTALLTSVEVLRGRATTMPATDRALLDVMAGELGRFRHLLEDLIDLARADAPGAVTDHRRPVDLTRLVRHVLAEAGLDRSLLRDAPAHPVRVRADPRLVQRLLVNLLDNAAAHAGGVTAVRVRSSGAQALLDVDDAGPGVPPHDRERIFERFARGGRRSATPGTGLGLSLVRDIAQRHGGDAWCVEGPAGGARFTVRLPQVTTGEQREELEPERAAGVGAAG